MRGIKPCTRKTHEELAFEWDRLAAERHRQILSGEDLSFEHVSIPTIFQLIEGADTTCVLDIGSGTGDFTAQLAQVVARVIAFESSSSSMKIAREICPANSEIRFVEAPFEKAAGTLREEQPTAAVAVMTLMSTPNLNAFATALAKVLQTGGIFATLLCHPWFWPRYWEYDSESWFNYTKEIFIEAPFSISKRRTEIITTHIHRPLEQYLRIFDEAGFRLGALVEPVPSPEIQALYPQPWRFPRFLGLRWVKDVC